MNVLDSITNETNFFVNDLLKNTIFPNIITFINNKYDVSVTLKELEDEFLLHQVKNKKVISYYGQEAYETCIWEYKRGPEKGQLCGKIAVSGKKYCTTCLKRPGLSKPEKVKKSAFVEPVDIDVMPKSNDGQILAFDVEVYDADKGQYINRATNFILQQDEKGIYTIGKADYTNEKIINKLTEEEITIAKSLNFPI
jgi:hypothetical protein